MLNTIQKIAIWWLLRRNQQAKIKRRYYIRPAHQNRIQDSFRLFQRYYESDDPRDLEGFCRLSPHEFDQLYAQLENKIGNHYLKHLRPIAGQQRLVVFLRYCLSKFKSNLLDLDI